MPVWPTIEAVIAEHGAAALVTLAESRGSSPREAGARMVVRPDGGFTGTIGGGVLEWTALAEAQAAIAGGKGKPIRRLDKALGPDLGQCCGGRVIITIERLDRDDTAMVAALAAAERVGPFASIGTVSAARLVRHPATTDEAARAPEAAFATLPDGRVAERFGDEVTPLYLFGAGHVGRALVRALADLPFAVTWVDGRPNAFPEQWPDNVTRVGETEPLQILERAPDGAFVAVMTHSHGLDLDLVMAALKSERFPYVGLIGSETKRARFVGAMRHTGFTEDMIARLICPIGLTTIRDKSPAAIATGIAAQLLMARESGAAAQTDDDKLPYTAPDRDGRRHA